MRGLDYFFLNLLHSFFYEKKNVGFGKKFKNKLRTMPGLLSRRT